MITPLSSSEAAAAFAAMIPGFRPNSAGKYRGKAYYRGGDNPTALSVDVERGVFFDQVTSTGGDVIELAKLHLGVDRYVPAAKFVSDLIGRNLLNEHSGKKCHRHTRETLAHAARFRVGLIWRIERSLAASKEELWGDRHNQAAAVVEDLTRWLAEVQKWSDYRSADVVKALSRRVPHLVRRCVEEAADTDRQLAWALAQSQGKLTSAA